MASLLIEPLRDKDLGAVAAMDADCGDVHWTPEHFRRELENARAAFFVLREDDRLLGYGGYWNLAPEAQITNLVIARARRGHGLGRALLKHLISHAAERGCRSMTLELRASNAAAMDLYQAEGFRETGRRNGFYTAPVEDAVMMERPL
jgi:ribosomal-protein-alanine N-acetyltransferase